MLLSKQQIIDLALEELGIANYVFDSSQGQYRFAITRLDMMIAGWNANGIRIAYPFASSISNNDLSTVVPVPDHALEAIVLNLAVRLAPSYKVQVLPETKQAADMSYSNMANQSVLPTPTRDLPRTLPLGQGNKPWRTTLRTYVYQPPEEILAGSDGELEIGPVNADNTATQFN